MAAVEQLGGIIKQMIREQSTPLATAWAVVKSVDWPAKTMVATGQTDNLDYYDVLLGLDSDFVKPKIGSVCMIGLVGTSGANAYLISARHIDEKIITSGDSEVTIKEDGIIIKHGGENLRTVFNDMIDEINKIIVVNGTSINVPAMTAIKQRLNTILIE